MTIIYLLAKESRMQERFRQLYPVLASKIKRKQIKYELLETTQIVFAQLALNSIDWPQQDVVGDKIFVFLLHNQYALFGFFEAAPPS